MSRTTVTFNGVTLTDLYVVRGWYTPLLGRNFDTVDIAGMDGQRFLGARLTPRSITLSLVVKGTSLTEREAAARTLAETLAVDEPKPLTASFMDGRYYLAIPRSDADLTRFVNADSFEVEFYVPDPVSYGETKTVEIPSINYDTSVSFTVGGNYPTLPTMRFTVHKSSTSPTTPSTFAFYVHDVNVRYTNGLYTYIDVHDVIRGSSLDGTFTIDSTSRTLARVSSDPVLLPLVSDWPILEPGGNRIYFSEGGTSYGCTGTGMLTFTERWL